MRVRGRKLGDVPRELRAVVIGNGAVGQLPKPATRWLSLTLMRRTTAILMGHSSRCEMGLLITPSAMADRDGVAYFGQQRRLRGYVAEEGSSVYRPRFDGQRFCLIGPRNRPFRAKAPSSFPPGFCLRDLELNTLAAYTDARVKRLRRPHLYKCAVASVLAQFSLRPPITARVRPSAAEPKCQTVGYTYVLCPIAETFWEQ